jgi:hypothetical protein
MKKLNRFRQAGGALLAISALVALPLSASALTFTWINGPQAGQAFTGGGIQIKAVNYDTGTLYTPLAVDTAVGFGVGGASGTVAAGETALNALPGRPALNGQAGEDSWGILKITQIQAYSGGVLHDIYNAAVNPYELTGIFWGVEDFYLKQVSAGSNLPGAGQIIDGTGLNVNIYSDATPDFSQVAGPGGRVGVSGYNTVTDGVLELSLQSTPGFINANGTLGGAATEFESNTASVGYSALNVIGGASAAQFNTNAIGFGGSSGASFLPGVGGQTSTDIWFSFTSTQGVNGWDITSNDPMLANISGVPDAGSTLLMLSMGLAFLGYGLRFRGRQS